MTINNRTAILAATVGATLGTSTFGADFQYPASVEQAARATLRVAQLTNVQPLRTTEEGGHADPPGSESAQSWARLALVTNDTEQVSSSKQGGAGREHVEEVIVTAQKRAERLQDVPISISVLAGTDLDSSPVSGITEALIRVPGVAATINQQGGATQVTVRGVTAGGAMFSGSSPIAYYIDTVPFGLVKSAIVPDTNAYDLQQVEVLRGPQGTLYGASAQNGVVRVLTRDADLDALEFKARTSASTTEEGGQGYRADMAIGVPILPGKLAVRAVLGYQDVAGWIDKPNDKDVNDGRLRNVRFKINGELTSNLSFGLSTWSTRDEYGAPPVSDDNDQHSSVVDESTRSEYDVYGLKIQYSGSGYTLSNSASYLEYTNSGVIDFAPIEFFETLFTGLDADVFSNELILNSATGAAWKWSLGAFYRDAEDRLRQNALGGGIPFDYSNASESYAIFGELARRFGDRKWEWTLGLRYFNDDVALNENISQGAPGEPAIHRESSYSSTSPRAVLTWYPSDSVTVYGSYSEGFRSGFSQDPGVIRTYPSFPNLQPDTLHNYEVGAKFGVLEGRLLIDTAVYYVDWEDVQQTLTVPFGGTNVTALVNGEAASGPGVDFLVTAKPLDRLEMSLSASYNDLTMDSAVLSEGVQLFGKGDRLNVSPEYTLGASIEYAVPMGSSGLDGRFSASASYSSPIIQRAVSGGAYFEAEGQSLLLGQSSFSVNSQGPWSATLYVDNVGNERGAAMRDPFGVPVWSLRVRPRTYGLQAEYRF